MTTYSYIKAITVSVAELYGTENPPIPHGYRATGIFAPPAVDQWYLNTDGYPCKAGRNLRQDDPRIILEKMCNPPLVLLGLLKPVAGDFVLTNQFGIAELEKVTDPARYNGKFYCFRKATQEDLSRE